MDERLNMDDDEETEYDTSKLSIPVNLRTIEPRQLRKFIPTAIEVEDVDSRRETLNDIRAKVEDAREHLSLTFDEWSVLLSSLYSDDVRDAHSRLAPWWLYRKLSSRVRNRIEDLQ